MDGNIILINCMTEYYAKDPARIQHFIKVFEFAREIGLQEKLDSKTQHILETAAIVHDIGIKPAEEKYHSSAGNYQELEGPPVAEALLTANLYQREVVERVSFLVGHHHTYDRIEGMDYQILVEADFLVNFYEDRIPHENIVKSVKKIFKTETGIRIAKTMYGLTDEELSA